MLGDVVLGAVVACCVAGSCLNTLPNLSAGAPPTASAPALNPVAAARPIPVVAPPATAPTPLATLPTPAATSPPTFFATFVAPVRPPLTALYAAPTGLAIA